MVIADIESAARDATRLFEPENRGVLSDPRVRFLVADGRNALLARKDTYDVILSDPSDVWVAGVGNLFTQEFYALARSRLRPGGVMVQWFHMHSLPPEDMKLIVATFRSVFPHTAFWRPNRGDVILLGTVEPTPWDIERLRQRVETVPGVSEDLLAMGFWQPLSIFSAFVLDGEDLSRMLVRRRGPALRQPARHRVPDAASGLRRHDRDQRRRHPGAADQTAAGDRGLRRGAGLRLPREVPAGIRLRVDRPDRCGDRDDGAERPGADAEAKFFVGLGNQYRVKEWNGKAIAAYGRALERDPADTEASLHLAELLRAQGDDAGAEKALRAALGLARDDAALALAAARLLLETGRAAEALPLIAPGLAKEPQNAALQLVSGGPRGFRPRRGSQRRAPASRRDGAGGRGAPAGSGRLRSPSSGTSTPRGRVSPPRSWSRGMRGPRRPRESLLSAGGSRRRPRARGRAPWRSIRTTGRCWRCRR